VKAVISVNTFGCPLDTDALNKLNIDCIEDWAHGFRLGADGKSPAKLISKVAIQSFYATKLIGVGEGGVVLTNSPDIAEHVRNWRDYADQLSDATRLNDKMTDISASIGIVQLKRLPLIIQRRAELASRYMAAFSVPEWLRDYVELPHDSVDRVWYRYPIYLKYWNVRVFIGLMREAGVMTDIPVCDWRPSGSDDCPVTERAFKRIISLPLYPSLNIKEQAHVIKTFLNVSQFCIEKYGNS
jgi:perosamine synthetase